MEEVLKCQICFERFESNQSGYNYPVLLSCGHGLCDDCCNMIFIQETAFNCPFCRRKDLSRVANRDLMNVIEAYATDQIRLEELLEEHETISQLNINNQVEIRNLKEENEKITERLERVRSNNREEILYWQQKNSDLEDKLESKESELALLKSKFEQLKDSISTHCGLLLTQINTNECTSSASGSSTNKRKIRD
jgi:hypothetical protein